jgi:hypothetical protein
VDEVNVDDHRGLNNVKREVQDLAREQSIGANRIRKVRKTGDGSGASEAEGGYACCEVCKTHGCQLEKINEGRR